jgi:hypothetical protein
LIDEVRQRSEDYARGYRRKSGSRSRTPTGGQPALDARFAELPLDQVCEGLIGTRGTRSVHAPLLPAGQANEGEGESVTGSVLGERSANGLLGDSAMRFGNDDQFHGRPSKREAGDGGTRSGKNEPEV